MRSVDIFLLSYNRGCYIGEAIESMLAQTFTDFRLIVLDNCSTDSTKEIVSGFDNVEFLSAKKNEGFYRNLMRIKEVSTSTWVMAFHDDDIIHSRYLENAFRVIEQNKECSLVGTNYRGHKKPSLTELNQIEFDEDCWKFEDASHFSNFCMTDNKVAFSSCLYRRDSFLRLRSDGMKEFGKTLDRPLMIDACRNGSAFIFKGHYLHYRVHESQDSQSSESGPFLHEGLSLAKYYRTKISVSSSLSRQLGYSLSIRSFLKGMYKWSSDRRKLRFTGYVWRAYRSSIAPVWIFVPRPIMRYLRKLIRLFDSSFF
jgi:glycosyltransferase involved in cell wall biosynthesis